MANQRDIKDLVTEYRGKGWQVILASKHWKFIPPSPDASIIYCAKTPSDHRTIKNTQAMLSRVDKTMQSSLC